MPTITPPKITPFLWFNDNAEEAMNFYCSIFKNSKPGTVSRAPDGKAFSVTFNLEGQEFYAMNGGPHYKLTPAFSIFVNCENQEEVDELWNKLISDGGKESRCGWLVDKFGLSWQIIPKLLGQLMGDKDREKANRAIQAMLQMSKIDCKLMQDAFDGK
jgi:predicted 3-demethylubiquinone-9 3-methyltransferase (glyoxalase superfamily)